MNSRAELINDYPNIVTVIDRVELDQNSFNAQKLKNENKNAEGGAIGIIWLDKDSVVLARRTKLHPGWSLVGGTVEHSQSFKNAFLREAKEETGLDVQISRLVMLVQKIFISPNKEELEMDLAVFEAIAKPGQKIHLTTEAVEEGLEVRAFHIHDLPDVMVMKDREKLEEVISARNR